MAEAIVIGGGAVGLAIARELRRRGLSVILLERNQPGRAASWASAGIVSDPIGRPDDANFQLDVLSRQLWPTFVEALQAESGMDPEFRESGCLIPALDDAEAESLACLIRAGLVPTGQLLPVQALREAEPVLSPSIQSALWRPGGNVDNRRLCKALEISNRRQGVEIRTGAEVRTVVVASGRVRGVELVDDHLSADLVVAAAGAWSSQLAGCQPRLPIVPQRGQILALDGGPVNLRQVILASGDPYLVPRADGRIIVGATREFAGWDTSLTAGGVAGLLTRAIRMVPALADRPIQEMWTGFRPISPDGIPLIGPGQASGLFICTGHGPHGIGPLPGTTTLLSALIFGEEPPIPAKAFRPERFTSGERA
jgi:glycine oxidase